MRHALQVAEQDRFAVGRCQFGQNARNALAQCIHRVQLGLRFGGQILRQRHLRFAQAQPVEQQIARDMEKPGPRIVELAETFTLQQSLKKKLLQQIVCIDGMPGAMQQEVSYFGLVRLPRLFEASEG